MVPNSGLSAYWTSQQYAKVAEYYNADPVVVTNTEPGILVTKEIYLDQVSRDFNVENQYTLRFTPTNPIPKIGMVKVTYPIDVAISDETAFVKACGAITTLSFTGPTHCSLDVATRTVWIYDIFRDQDQYTSEVNLQMTFTNPKSNDRDELDAS